jgi:hypothetical protein
MSYDHYDSSIRYISTSIVYFVVMNCFRSCCAFFGCCINNTLIFARTPLLLVSRCVVKVMNLEK